MEHQEVQVHQDQVEHQEVQVHPELAVFLQEVLHIISITMNVMEKNRGREIVNSRITKIFQEPQSKGSP